MARSKNVSGEDAPRALSKAKDWFDLSIYICIVPPKKIETLFTYVIYICDIYIYIYIYDLYMYAAFYFIYRYVNK